MRLLIFGLFSAALLAEDGMALIPAGDFTIGRTKLTPDDKTTMRPRVLLDDRPDHKVTLDAFWLDKTEVTHAAYAKFLEAVGRNKPYHWQQRPAGDGLPTEAEWERAAR